MLSLKKRFIICVVLILVFVATALPVGAQDDGGPNSPHPVYGTVVIIHIGWRNGGFEFPLWLPVRCGNNC